MATVPLLKTTPKNSDSKEIIISDDKLDGCFTSMYVMLAAVHDVRVKASSISYVPEQLKKSGAEAYYMPKVVSIGPLHRGSRRELLYMEEIKWRCMLCLFQRTVNPEDSHKKCSNDMFNLIGLVRATYANDIKFDAYDLAKIMLLDGCFLLELLISNDKRLDSDQKYEKKEEPEKESPGAEIGKMPLVLSDLKLLENQVPIVILIKLFQWLFCPTPAEEEKAEEKEVEEKKAFEDVRKIVNDSALILFGCDPDSIPAKYPRAAHFLELLHWFMTREVDANDQENNDPSSITLEVAIDQENNDHRSQRQRCATRLEAAGVKIESLKAQQRSDKVLRNIGSAGSNPVTNCTKGKKNEKPVVQINFGCDMKSEGKLQIQPLCITEITEVLWRNLIAWEQNRIIHEKFLLKDEIRTRCKFSEYALLFNDLVCCEHDIQLLKDRRVLLSVEDGDRRSNEDLMNLFRNVAKELQIDPSGDVRFAQLIDQLNAHSGATARGYCRIFWHLCRCIVTNIRYTCRWLRGNHIFTAAYVALILTIAQTIFGAIELWGNTFSTFVKPKVE